ncbi:MAG: DEAD/DEAH box helicase [Oscillospiraceae bacterium]|nr:DEAD/DEAH box helicase [Oscillospiraceae bacterium]
MNDTFDSLALHPALQRAVAEMGYTQATSIQLEAIPALLADADVTGRSGTGTGKTAAFGLPCLQKAAQPDAPVGGVLILTPTRELAQQIVAELHKFSKYLGGVSIAAVFGGASMPQQIKQLKTAKIVVGTPGRIMDHLRRKTLKLEALRTVVLDEADEMLNMGFIDDIETILSSAPAQRQTALFSATMPPAIMALTRRFQREPLIIKADGGRKTADGIRQYYYEVPQGAKKDAVKLLLEKQPESRTLIFCNTKKMVDELCAALNDAGFRCAGLHGDMRQNQRTAVMEEFKRGKCNVLIATDVAARGIDVDGMASVINYDIPQDNEYYIHRIGRTGRAGREGESHTLTANRAQVRRVRELSDYLGCSIAQRAVPTVKEIGAQRRDTLMEELRGAIRQGEGEAYRDLVQRFIDEGDDPAELAAVLCARLLKKQVRLSGVRDIDAAAQKPTSGFVWVRADIGSGAGIAPNFIVGAITEKLDISSKEIGKIRIYENHTDVELTQENAAAAVREMQNIRIKGRGVHFTFAKEPAGAVSTRRGAQRPFRPKNARKSGYTGYKK